MAKKVIRSASVIGHTRKTLNDNFDEVYADVAALQSTAPIIHWVDISYAASTTTDGLEATLSVKNSLGGTIASSHVLEVWISRDADGSGLTNTSASGALTAVTGKILTALTEKKHIIGTCVNGVLKLLLVDSANTAGERFCVRHPVSQTIIYGTACTAAHYEGGA
jgi:hypothetical protein